MVKSMTTKNKRLHPRIDSLNLLSYSCIDETGQVVAHGMGRTLNVSQGGILLETRAPVDKGQTVLLSIGLEDDMTEEVEGRVVFSTMDEDYDRFQTGIEFINPDKKSKRLIKQYVDAFLKQLEE